jgi:hypothetical protein
MDLFSLSLICPANRIAITTTELIAICKETTCHTGKGCMGVMGNGGETFKSSLLNSVIHLIAEPWALARATALPATNTQ